MEKNTAVKTVNHWGKWVSSDIPVTGVLSNNSINWEFIDNEICLDCEEAMKQEEAENPDNPDYDYIECDGSHTKLIGDWTLDTKTGQYEPSKDCKFAAIVRESVTQVVKSKYTQKGALCSPCYPGQVDLDSDGDFLGYTLPEDMIYNPDKE